MLGLKKRAATLRQSQQAAVKFLEWTIKVVAYLLLGFGLVDLSEQCIALLFTWMQEDEHHVMQLLCNRTAQPAALADSSGESCAPGMWIAAGQVT